MNAIEVRGLKKKFRSAAVLDGLELSIPPGSIYGLFGRNGAGKTTLLNCLIGLMHPSAGEARVLGADLANGCPPEKAQVAYVAQGEFLPSWAQIEHLIRFEAALRPAWDHTLLVAWMRSERLDPRRNVGELSVGQRKRLELELALAAQPNVMILDEPFAGLDPVSRAEFTEQLLGYTADHQPTVILSSHALNDLERLCDRVGLLGKGVIAYEGDLDALKEGAAIIRCDDPNAPWDLPAHVTEVATRKHEDVRTWVVVGAGKTEVQALEANGYRVSRGNLEDIGVELIRCLDGR